MSYKAGEQDRSIGRSHLLGARYDSRATYVMYSLFAILGAAGPVTILCGVLLASEPVAMMIVGGLALVSVTPTAWFAARSLAEERRRQGEVDRGGVPAVADVVAVRFARTGGHAGVRLSLRISGEGFDPFDAVVVCDHESWMLAGVRLAALVEPRKGLFTILRERPH